MREILLFAICMSFSVITYISPNQSEIVESSMDQTYIIDTAENNQYIIDGLIVKLSYYNIIDTNVKFQGAF